MPSLVDTNVDSSKRCMLKPTHGPTTSAAAMTTAKANAVRSAQVERAVSATTSPRSGTNRTSSARPSPTRPQPAPSARARSSDRTVPEREREQARADDREPGQRLRHHEPVVDPDVRRDRRDARGDRARRCRRRHRAPRVRPADRAVPRAERAPCRTGPSRSGLRGRSCRTGRPRSPTAAGARPASSRRASTTTVSGGWSAAGGGFSPGMRHRPQRLGEAVTGRDRVGLGVVEDLVADRALARVAADHFAGELDVARSALGDRDVARRAHRTRRAR